MRAVHFLLPGDLDTPTGGYRYDRMIIQGLRERGYPVRLHRLDDSFPEPTPAALDTAAQVLAGIPDGATVIIDGLAYGPLLPVLKPRHRLLALIHHPLASETGLSPSQQARLRSQEQQALQLAQQVIVTSPATARELRQDYGVTQPIQVLLPGTPRVMDPPMPSTTSTLEMLCVATIVPRKGHRILLEALAHLRHHDWHLSCVGSLDRHPPSVTALHQQMQAHGLASRVRLCGAVSAETLAQYYRRADLFVLPSFHEGYGMVLAEALSFGLPIISTTAGAIPETVPEGTALLVPPGDSQALHQALALVFEQPGHRLQMAENARQAAQKLPDWEQTIQRFAALLPGECHDG